MQNGTKAPWILGTATALLSLLGLVMASNAVDNIFYATGLTITTTAIIALFAIIKKHVR